MIKVKNLYKYYLMGKEKFCALRNVNLEIKKGDFVIIMGPSGSGKSTLLNIIGGLDRPSQGEVWVDGENIFKLRDRSLSKYRREKIGFVFQAFHLEPTYTVFENVMLPLMFSNTKDKERRVKEAIEKVGLTSKIKNKAVELSGGERQRVAIARAIVNNPDILLCDEPTGNLDSKNGMNIINLLKQLNNEGKTILMVTHNSEYMMFGSKFLKIKDGSIEEVL